MARYQTPLGNSEEADNAALFRETTRSGAESLVPYVVGLKWVIRFYDA